METKLQSTLLISLLCIVLIPSFASLPARDSLGISPQDASYYKTSVIKCKDGSKKFTRDQLNDEFCDCPDGTDEPGTSACPEGKFYCQNVGHSPLVIFSSRVNDGICDCCDGSDEYDGKANCSNTCWEAGKAARDKLRKKIATYQEGVIIRNKEVEKAKFLFAKDESDLSKLKNEEKMLKGLVDKLKEQKERIEKAEEEERLKKEAEEKRIKEEEEAKKQAMKESEATDSSQNVAANEEIHEKVLVTSDKEVENGDQVELKDETNYHAESEDSVEGALGEEITGDHDEHSKPVHGNDESTSDESSSTHVPELDTEGLSREELGRLVASRWTGEKASEQQNENPKDEKHEYERDLTPPEPAEEGGDRYDGYSSEIEEDRHKYDEEDEYDDDLSDEEFRDDYAERTNSYKSDDDNEGKTDHSGELSWLDRIQQTVQNVLQSFNFFKTPVDLSEASRVRKEYDDASSKLSKIQSKISNLNDKLKHDFGKDNEFFSFYDQCFENKQNKYTYKVCPFKRASQVEGHSSTELGRWDKFEDSYRVMAFTNGDRCWNGPDRSLKVRLRCGLKNELTDVDEPSRCEYVAILSTPALCVEERLKELKQKLDDLNASQPSNHDEL